MEADSERVAEGVLVPCTLFDIDIEKERVTEDDGVALGDCVDDKERLALRDTDIANVGGNELDIEGQ